MLISCVKLDHVLYSINYGILYVCVHMGVLEGEGISAADSSPQKFNS